MRKNVEIFQARFRNPCHCAKPYEKKKKKKREVIIGEIIDASGASNTTQSFDTFLFSYSANEPISIYHSAVYSPTITKRSNELLAIFILAD